MQVQKITFFPTFILHLICNQPALAASNLAGHPGCCAAATATIVYCESTTERRSVTCDRTARRQTPKSPEATKYLTP